MSCSNKKKVIKHKRWCDSTDYVKDMAKSIKPLTDKQKEVYNKTDKVCEPIKSITPLTDKQKEVIKLMFDNLKDF